MRICHSFRRVSCARSSRRARWWCCVISGNVRSALDNRIGTDLLFPVYRHVRAQGAGFDYEVIVWVGFHLTGYSIGGKGQLFGSFTRIIWDGIQSDSGTPDDFGARSISLTD